MRALSVVVLVCCVQPLAAEPLACPNGMVTASTDDAALSERICRVSDRAIALFAECGFELPQPVEITTLAEVEDHCFGVFYCDEARIELRTPDAMELLRKEESVFVSVATEDFFDSVVVHELAHALYNETECPYTTCLATGEYFAYTYQIMSLDDDDRASVESQIDMERRISRDYIVGILAVMSPNRFTERVWTHFSQREDQCAWLDGILSGAILFDHDYP